MSKYPNCPPKKSNTVSDKNFYLSPTDVMTSHGLYTITCGLLGEKGGSRRAMLVRRQRSFSRELIRATWPHMITMHAA